VVEDIAIPRQIDAKHRARQDLGPGSLGHDLFFLRHRKRIFTNSSLLKPPPAATDTTK
jgi:hypothetical protein